MITEFAPKMIMGLAPEHSDIENHRFWEMDKSLTIIKNRCEIHAFPSSLRKMKSPKIVFGNRFLFLGTDFSFLGAFLGKREDIGKEGFRVCVRKTTRDDVKSGVSASQRRYAEHMTHSSPPMRICCRTTQRLWRSAAMSRWTGWSTPPILCA